MDELTLTAKAELLDYLLGERSDCHPMFGGRPTLNDLCYTIFMHARLGTNGDDGGPVDWFNDTIPLVDKAKRMYRAELERALTRPDPAAGAKGEV